MTAEHLVAFWKRASLLPCKKRTGKYQPAIPLAAHRIHIGTMGRLDANLTIQTDALSDNSKMRKMFRSLDEEILFFNH